MQLETKLIYLGIMAILTNVIGICLSKTGRPYNKILFNIHKLIALVTVVYIVFIFIDLLKGMPIEISIIILIIIMFLSILSLFITGAFLSIGKFSYKVLRIIHIISPFIAVISSVLSLYLLTKG